MEEKGFYYRLHQLQGEANANGTNDCGLEKASRSGLKKMLKNVTDKEAVKGNKPE
jgi:hypothetical protein